MLGFARDVALAAILGAGAAADAFFVAFKLPNFFRRMLAEGTLTAAVIPVLTEARQKGEDVAHRYLDALTTALLVLLTLLVVAGELGMERLLALFAPGLVDDPLRWHEALTLARWMFPYLAMITLAALSWAVLNAYKRFSLAAASPALLNIALLFAALVLAPAFDDPARALAVGVLLGGVLQLGAQIPALARLGWRWRPSWAWRDPRLMQTLRLFGPALASIAAVQINILIGTILATLLPTGAISQLYYADRLVQLPLALFGIAMGAALLPTLSELFRDGRTDEARRTLADGLAWLGWITLPAAAGLALLAEPIVRALFERGRFGAADAEGAALALVAYTLGLVAFCWTKALAAGCYARRDAQAPMRYAFASVGINLVASLLLMRPLGAAGLALATSIAAWANALLLYRRLADGAPLLDRTQARRLARAIAASAAMTALLAGAIRLIPFPDGGELARLAWAFGAAILGLAVFLLLARMLGEPLSIPRRR